MKKHFRAIGDFWRVEYGRYVGMTAIAFLVLVVLAYIAGRLFPDIPVTVIGAFNEVVAGSGIVQEDGKLVWECPKCHNRDQNKLNVARRTCGYIGTQFWNQGRTAEIKDRVLHL